MHSYTTSTQPVFALSGGELVQRTLPAPHRRLKSSGLVWGAAEVPMTPAYWAAQCWMWELDEPEHFRLGRSLAEEVLACILGGYGIPAEVGLAAYHRLRAMLDATPDRMADEAAVHELLTAPLEVSGRSVRYRFASQKAGYIAGAFRDLAGIDDGLGDRDLRDRLTEMRGFGPKTASWIVRNWRASDQVAILDIHILRAGQQIGIFKDEWRIERHYSRLEDAYLAFAADLGAKASILDSVMWMTMRQLTKPTPKAVSTSKSHKPTDQPDLFAIVA